MFFEVGSDGHRIDYIERILAALSERPVDREVIFVLSPDFRENLSRPLIDGARRRNSVELVYLTDDESRKCEKGSGIGRRLSTTQVFTRYLKTTGAAFGFVNYFDFVLTGLALPWFSKTSAPVSGILFRPSAHYASLGRGSNRPQPFVRKLVTRAKLKGEDFVYRRALNNPNVAAILSLDPIFPEYARATYEHGEKVKMLPEPYSGLLPATAPNQDANRVTFLMIGAITKRKGIYETLTAFQELTDTEASNARLIVAGRVKADTREPLDESLADLEKSSPNLQVIVKDEFLTEETFGSLINDSHVVLAPYREHVGSSGILAWAAHYKRPVITQRYGVVGELVERHSLGLVCDPANSSEFASCLRQAIKKGPESISDVSGMAEFDEQNTSQGFLRGIFEASGLSGPST